MWLNENDPYAVAWLGNLIGGGRLRGRIDPRSIVDVRPSDIDGRHCHFFAGIGGWPYALELAGWPDDWEVWTASLPCQPLSVAGKRLGADDERHLWPVFYRLVAERRPATIFGEQVASKDGREWLAAVRADLEEIGYAVAAACLPACGVGAPHRRYRLFWVAADGGSLADGDATGWRIERSRGLSGDGDASYGNDADRRGAWDDLEWIFCRDGKWRPTQPGLQPLALGVPSRVGRLRAYGNAIVAPLATEFIRAYLEAEDLC